MKRHAVVVVAAALGSTVLAGCTAATEPADRPAPAGPGEYRLVSFSDCGAALTKLRTAARENLGAWGMRRYGFDADNGVGSGAESGTRVDAADAARGGPQAPAPDGAKAAPDGEKSTGHSGTNNHESGVDEPDLVKTDGKRIVTVQGGILRVVDAASRTQTARLDVRPAGSGQNQVPPGEYRMTEMLLAGDKVLLVGSMSQGYYPSRGFDPERRIEPQLTLVDLAGTPKIAGRFGMSGSLVDARQVGSTARVVMRSSPQIERPGTAGTRDAYTAAMMANINKADITDWLPTYTVEDGGTVSTGRVDCSAVSHPTEFSANTMLTVLTFDLTRGSLGDGSPVTIVADGETVYSNGPSLYVASDQRWRATPAREGDGRGDIGGDGAVAPTKQQTEIYKFDTSKPGKPAFVAGGAVEGWLLNQYSMSDWNGHLRVATTTGVPTWAGAGAGQQSESTVHVLRHDGKQLAVVGKVGGLGRNERIYSVRFVAGTGYVVTFRQTDPLYTVDLRDPAKPVVTGELKITGYSAYLHPAGEGMLLGIGQEASEQGRVQGTQISLFDVRDPAKPNRLAQYHVKGAHSEAEFDPHAFLYWPQSGLLVVPLNDLKTGSADRGVGALALRIADGGITELGFIAHPAGAGGENPMIRRSLIIEGTLWTVSPKGLLASDTGNATQQAWVPFT
jgi:hypothetical protein